MFTAVVTTILAVVVVAGSSSAATRSANAFHSVVVAKLTPRAEASVTKASKHATGTAKVTINLKLKKACWTVTVKGLEKADKFLSADVHKAPAKKTGPVVIPLGYTKKHLQGAVRGQLRAG